eukprot:scaffold150239_cov21-Tisochrysis_lutea.AAC.1
MKCHAEKLTEPEQRLNTLQPEAVLRKEKGASMTWCTATAIKTDMTQCWTQALTWRHRPRWHCWRK